jgi:hypothetical protein
MLARQPRFRIGGAWKHHQSSTRDKGATPSPCRPNLTSGRSWILRSAPLAWSACAIYGAVRWAGGHMRLLEGALNEGSLSRAAACAASAAHLVAAAGTKVVRRARRHLNTPFLLSGYCLWRGFWCDIGSSPHTRLTDFARTKFVRTVRRAEVSSFVQHGHRHRQQASTKWSVCRNDNDRSSVTFSSVFVVLNCFTYTKRVLILTYNE